MSSSSCSIPMIPATCDCAIDLFGMGLAVLEGDGRKVVDAVYRIGRYRSGIKAT